MFGKLPDNASDAFPTTRRCGSCDLCCTAVGVEGMHKAPAVRCPALKGEPGQSCSIYKERPYDCRQFLCVWRHSDRLIPQELWPANAGFVIAVGDVMGPVVLLTVHPDPARPDAWKAHRDLFKELARKFNGIVAVGQGNLAVTAFSPKGREFPRVMFPGLFAEGGKRVGLPENEFFPRMLTLQERANLLFDL
jgi:hypothetical protein